MGRDAWGQKQSAQAYLRDCRSSLKYAKGRWFVLTEDDPPVSSALVHDIADWDGLVVRGIGSMATAPGRRRQRFGGSLLKRLIAFLRGEEKAKIILLYADIAPEFYARRGFRALDARQQSRPGSLAMAWTAPGCPAELFETHAGLIPPYF